jgi:hypothetical protein
MLFFTAISVALSAFSIAHNPYDKIFGFNLLGKVDGRICRGLCVTANPELVIQT